MRDIEIKAWHIEQKEMIDLQAITPLALDTGMNDQLAMQGRHGLFIPFFKELILLQYTGLKDKNGVKIWEGDILRASDREVEVKWHEHAGCWDCDFIRYKGEVKSNGLVPGCWKYDAEVIGNIYENPELLNK